MLLTQFVNGMTDNEKRNWCNHNAAKLTLSFFGFFELQENSTHLKNPEVSTLSCSIAFDSPLLALDFIQ